MPRKAKKGSARYYFTQKTEDAIIRYNNEERPFMRNRTFMGLLSLQSRFQISLGMIPHALRSPRGLGKRNLPIN